MPKPLRSDPKPLIPSFQRASKHPLQEYHPGSDLPRVAIVWLQGKCSIVVYMPHADLPFKKASQAARFLAQQFKITRQEAMHYVMTHTFGAQSTAPSSVPNDPRPSETPTVGPRENK